MLCIYVLCDYVLCAMFLLCIRVHVFAIWSLELELELLLVVIVIDTCNSIRDKR